MLIQNIYEEAIKLSTASKAAVSKPLPHSLETKNLFYNNSRDFLEVPEIAYKSLGSGKEIP